MSTRLLIGNLVSGLAGEGLGQTIEDFCDACASGDKVAIATILGGLTGGPLLAVGLLAGGVGLQLWGERRLRQQQREQFADLAEQVRACKGDTQQLIGLLTPIAERSAFVQARLPGYEKAELAQWVAKEVKKALGPALPEGEDPIDWDVLRIYVESNKAILDELRAIATETRDNTAEVLDILKTGRARLPGIPEGVQNNLALAGIRPNADFEGRRDLIERVHEVLTTSGTAALAHALSAEGGVGKTEIAIAYVFDAEYANAWDGIWWLDASTGALDGSLAATLDGLGYQRQKGDDAEALRRELIRRLGDGRHLVVLDNVDHRSTLESFAVGANTRVLATTRLAPERIPPSVAQAIPVDLLDEAEATAVLLKHRRDLLDPESGEIAAEHAGAIAGILEELDGHALAVALCAAALRTDTGLSPANLLEQLRANELEAKGHALEHVEADATGRKYGLKVAASLLLLLPGVEAQHPLAPKLLLAASLVHPSKIPVSLLVAATGADEGEARRAILALRDRSIVRFEASAGVEGKGLVSMHRLTQSAVRGQSDDETSGRALAGVVGALNGVFEECTQVDRWPVQGEALPHATDALDRLEGDGRPASLLLNQVAFYLDAQGRAADAEPLYEQALDMCRRLFEGDHPDIARSLNNLAFVRQALGRAGEAEPLHEEALAMQRRLFEGDHPDVAMTLNNLAGVRETLGRAGEAEPLYEEALAMQRRLFGGDHPDVAMSLNNLAGVRESLGRAGEAEPLYEQALDMRRRLFEGDHPHVAGSLNNLAFVRQALGRAGEAAPLYEQGLAMQRRLYESDHPRVAGGLNNLAGVRQALGRAGEAEPLYEEALAMQRRLFGGDHPDVAMGLNNLAFVRAALGRAEEADSLYQEALDMFRLLFKGDHPHVAMVLNNLAGVRQALGRAGEAEPLYEEALDMRRRLFDGDHPGVANSLNNLAINRVKLKRWRDAVPLAEEAVDMGRRCLPAGHPWLQGLETNLAAIREHLDGQ
ncbi:MAG: FxSxx-COOH system tetratricopeptide repeat protein [Phycisphaerales bacterium]